ncbi:glutathione S-transferase family protein [Leptolyngbya ectocarpi]|uniref:glutathione S-transferase family protein n=1 Tax=Leptolyngbya ectocarpi TaxID=1202 RepID=UPI001D148344|nr:glutathione S-transferase family protein [Leptolyngbya ectocarpi]
MLKFYYNPVSVNARCVWVALLEKQISFESILVNLDGDQLNNNFTAINPLLAVQRRIWMVVQWEHIIRYQVTAET